MKSFTHIAGLIIHYHVLGAKRFITGVRIRVLLG